MNFRRTIFQIALCLMLAGTIFRGFAGPGDLDLSFTNASPSAYVEAVVVQPDGKVIIGGSFTSVKNTSRNHIARLNVDGTLDTSFDPGEGLDQPVRSMCLQPDGKVLLAGDFIFMNNSSARGVCRINTNGSRDTTFNVGTGAAVGFIGAASYVALQSDGKILVGGSFTNFNGTTVGRIVRLQTNGTVDSLFNPGTGANDWISCIAVQPDNRVLIGGQFTSVNGTNRNRIARLGPNGRLDLTFDPGTGVNDTVFALLAPPDGSAILAGSFTNVNGIRRRYLARLTGTGSLDETFNAGIGPDHLIFDIARQRDGKLLIGGRFSLIDGFSSYAIARLLTNGSLDRMFTSPAPDNYVYSVAAAPDGKVVIGGLFQSFGSPIRLHVARLFGDPSLMPQNSGTNLVLSWPTNYSSYFLEVNSGFSNAWTTVSNTRAVVSNLVVVTNVMENGTEVFRLKSP